MALYYNLYYEDIFNQHEWKIGDCTKHMNDYGRQCILLKASEFELKTIRHQFLNLPIHNNRHSVRWTGEMAAFIAMNLQPH